MSRVCEVQVSLQIQLRAYIFFRQREEQNGGTGLHCTARKLEKYFKMNVEQYADRDKKRALCMRI